MKSRLIYALLLIVILLIGLSYFKLTVQNKENQSQANKKQITEILKNHREIESIQINQVREGIAISVVIPGLAEGVFDLSLELAANGYVKDSLMSFNNEISLHLRKQEFNFYIPFNQLATKYREKLLNYIPFFEKEFHIDEYIELRARLRIKNNDTYDLPIAKSIEFPISEKIEILRFNFSCFKEKCEIFQSQERETGVN